MSILTLLILLIVFAFVLWLLDRYVLPGLPLPQGFARAILALIAILIIWYLLAAAGVLPSLNQPIR